MGFGAAFGHGDCRFRSLDAIAVDAAMAGGSVFRDANFPLTDDGRTFHLGVRAGDVAPRVLSVGDAGRAARIAAAHLVDRAPPIESARGFVTHTGSYRGVRVSVVATGMVRFRACARLSSAAIAHPVVAHRPLPRSRKPRARP